MGPLQGTSRGADKSCPLLGSAVSGGRVNRDTNSYQLPSHDLIGQEMNPQGYKQFNGIDMINGIPVPHLTKQPAAPSRSNNNNSSDHVLDYAVFHLIQ